MKYSPASLFLIIASTMNQHKEKITFKVAGTLVPVSYTHLTLPTILRV